MSIGTPITQTASPFSFHHGNMGTYLKIGGPRVGSSPKGDPSNTQINQKGVVYVGIHHWTHY